MFEPAVTRQYPEEPLVKTDVTRGQPRLVVNEDSSIACVSCHPQATGFSDAAVQSLGFDGGTTRRNSMGLVDSRFYARGRYFWDERAATLDTAVFEGANMAEIRLHDARASRAARRRRRAGTAPR